MDGKATEFARQHVDSGVVLNMPRDQTEATVRFQDYYDIMSLCWPTLAQFTLHATWGVDATYKALTLKGSKD